MSLERFLAANFIPALDASYRTDQLVSSNVLTAVDSKGNQVKFKMVEDIAGGASARIFKSYSRDANALKPIAVKRIHASAFKDSEEEFTRLLHRERQAMEELSVYNNFVPEYYGYYYYAPNDEHWLAMELCVGASVFALSVYFLQSNQKEASKLLDKFPGLKNYKRNIRHRRNKQRSKSLLGLNVAILSKDELHALATLNKKSVNLHAVEAVAAGVLRGLEAIHKAGYIHGDIKTGNILLCYPGIVKICDFGLTSKVVGVENPDLHALGTLDYMAPEQMLKNLLLDQDERKAVKFKYNHKIDVWALGIVVLELLLGRTPLSDLKRYNEEEFNYFVANMCKQKHAENRGSALGLYFYLPNIVQEVLKEHNQLVDRDKRRLCERNPVLQENQKFLLELLMRTHLYGLKPDPKLEVPRPKVPQLYGLNKCLDFIAQCLFIKYSWRPDATDLQNHSFVKSACKELQSLEPKYSEISKMQKMWGQRNLVWKKYKCSLTIHEIFKILELDKADLKRETFSLDNKSL